MKRTKSMTLAVAVAVMMCVAQLVACGGGAPTTDSIETHIDSPTGNVDDTSMSTAFNQMNVGQGQASGSVAPPTGSTSQPLTAQAVVSMTPEQTLLKVGVPQKAVAWLQPQLVLQQPTTQPGAAPLGGLVLKQSKNPLECMDKLDLKSKNIDVTMDMGCLAKGSGTIRIKTQNIGITDMSQNPDEIDGRAEVIFDNACDDKGTCIDGHYRLHLDISKANKRAKIVAGYKVAITIKGKTTIKTKGGMRVNSIGDANSIELVVFVKDASGQEGSIVLMMAQNGQNKSFAVKGANGTFSCQTDGAKGKCKATKGDDTKEVSWSLR